MNKPLYLMSAVELWRLERQNQIPEVAQAIKDRDRQHRHIRWSNDYQRQTAKYPEFFRADCCLRNPW